MASDKDRAKIMAEYLQHDDDDDDEEEFQEDDYEDDDEDDDDDDDENQDATNPQSTNEHYAILNGHLTLNDEGRLVYSGTWCMKKDLELHESLDDAQKKKTKFKLKSKQALGANGKFDLLNPLLSSSSSGGKKTRIVVMDGFFTTDKTDAIEPHRKIKEQNVEFVFSQGVPMMKRDDGSGSGSGSGSATHDNKMNRACFVVKGTGTNDFGNFTLEGIYCPDDDSNKDPAGQELKCSKRYIFANTMKRGRDYDSEDDYVISDDEAVGADVEELIGLADDAALSVEALRKKYYGGGGGGAPDDDDDDESTDEELDRKMPAKKFKTADDDDDDDDDYNRGRGRGRGNDDDDDDGCGF